MQRHQQTFRLTQSSHLFVGPGRIERLTIKTVDDGDEIFIFDTDRADTTNSQQLAHIVADVNDFLTHVPTPIIATRGAYIQLGANAEVDAEVLDRILVHIGLARAGFMWQLADVESVGLSGSVLHEDAVGFFENCYRDGLAEMRFVQGMDPTRRGSSIGGV